MPKAGFRSSQIDRSNAKSRGRLDLPREPVIWMTAERVL
jgi:hypothetical protein